MKAPGVNYSVNYRDISQGFKISNNISKANLIYKAIIMILIKVMAIFAQVSDYALGQGCQSL